MPNLEQCALLSIEYKHLAESVVDDSLWQPNELLYAMRPVERQAFRPSDFDFFRKSFALSFSMLEPGVIAANTNKIKEKLKSPWTLDNNEKLEIPNHIRLERLSFSVRDMFSESAGYLSVFGRYLRKTANQYGIDIRGKQIYNDFTYRLFDFLSEAGWLVKKPAKTANNDEISIYQLKVDNILWHKGNGENIIPDLIRNRSYKPLNTKPNRYFQKFYQTNFHDIKPIEGREHTGANQTIQRERNVKRNSEKGKSECCSVRLPWNWESIFQTFQSYTCETYLLHLLTMHKEAAVPGEAGKQHWYWYIVQISVHMTDITSNIPLKWLQEVLPLQEWI